MILRPLVPLILLVLLLTQAASSVCSAQCMEQEQGAAGVMAGCGSMVHPTGNATLADCCPVRGSSICAITLPANSQDKIADVPSIEPDSQEVLPALPKSPLLTNAFFIFRSSVGDPPLITPLRV